MRAFCDFAFGDHLPELVNVEKVRGDVRDDAALAAACQGATDVVHLAAVVTDALVDMNPRKGRAVNVDATRGLCRASAEADIHRVIYASSSSVYGSVTHDVTEDEDPRPLTEYARTKLVGEAFMWRYRGSFEPIVVRMASLSGPAPRMRLDTIVNIFSKQAYYDGVLTVHGGGQWRCNLHIQDACEAYWRLLTAPRIAVADRVFNLVGSTATARDIAAEVAVAAGEALGRVPRTLTTAEVDRRDYRMSGARLKAALDWGPARTVADAARDNFLFFAAGGLSDPEDDIYYNTRRMAAAMKET